MPIRGKYPSNIACTLSLFKEFISTVLVRKIKQNTKFISFLNKLLNLSTCKTCFSAKRQSMHLDCKTNGSNLRRCARYSNCLDV